jgi:PAS domain S-box-containing protein
MDWMSTQRDVEFIGRFLQMHFIRDIPLKRKLTLVILVTTSASLSLVYLGFVIYELVISHQTLRHHLSTLAEIAGENSLASLSFKSATDAKETVATLKAEPHVVGAALYTGEGRLFVTYTKPGVSVDFPAVPAGNEITFGKDNLSVFRPLMLAGKRIGTVYVQADSSEQRGRLMTYLGITTAVLGASSGMAWLLATRLQRMISEPILHLADTARIVSERHDYSVRAAACGRDEMGGLITAFNHMLEHIQTQDAALRRSEELYRTLIDSLPQRVFFKDLNSAFVSVNTAFASDFGLAPGDLIGKSDCHLFSKELAEKYCADDQRVMRQRQPVTLEEKNVIGEKERIVEVSKVPVCDGDGHLIGLLGLFKDITAHKRAEEALAEQAKELVRSNKELEQFAYVASHDLQEPLRMVASYTQLLARRYRGKLDADADEFIAYAVDGATRMQQLINDLLAYSRVGSRGRELEFTPCEEVLEQAEANLRMTIETNRASVTHDPLPQLMADRSQLVQLFQNLIGNAIKFHGEAPPHVHISAQPIKLVNRNGESQPGAGWRFAVQDNGIGIEPQYAERIFIIFQRLHSASDYPGTGIGLAVCKKIVERHGGRIWVESEPGKGATFFFSLPEHGEATHLLSTNEYDNNA